MSRSLATRTSLARSVYALGEETTYKLGAILQLLEEGNFRKLSGTGKARAKLAKYQVKKSEVFTYQHEANA